MTVSAEHGQRRTPTRGFARSILAQAAVLGLFLVAITAAAVAGLPTLSGTEVESSPREAPKALQTPASAPSPPPVEQQGPDVVMIIIGLVLLAVALTLLIVGIVRLVQMLVAIVRDRMQPEPDAVATEVETATSAAPDDGLDEATVQRGIAAALSSVAGHRDPGDAIIAAWLGLEETAADAGTGRGRAETPAEFTLRILLQRPGIDEPGRRLLALYEQVRFGGRRADEAMRSDAERALSAIERGWR